MKTLDDEMVTLAAEVEALKQWKSKSAATLQTVEATLTLEFDLELDFQWGIYIVQSNKRAIVEIDTGGREDIISISYNISGLDSRTIRNMPIFFPESGNLGHMAFIYSQNNDDLQKLRNGEEVHLTYEITVTSTAEVSASVTYEDNRP